MSVYVNWQNPYAERDGVWLRGNLHTHTVSGSACAVIQVGDSIHRYVAGYDFAPISDHMTLTSTSDRRIVAIPGVEWNSPVGEHTGVYSCNPHDIAAINLSDHRETLGGFAEKRRAGNPEPPELVIDSSLSQRAAYGPRAVRWHRDLQRCDRAAARLRDIHRQMGFSPYILAAACWIKEVIFPLRHRYWAGMDCGAIKGPFAVWYPSSNQNR